MVYPLFLTVKKIPQPEDIPALRRTLEIAFPHKENAAYLDALEKSPLPRVTAQRLGALSLLPSLLEAVGIDPTPLILRRDEQGRPYLQAHDGGLPFCGLTGVPTPVDFNLSHTDAHVAAALMIGEGRVGVDIEEPIPPARALPLIHRYCTAGELAILGTPPSDADAARFFTQVWVMREAIAKQNGGGQPLKFDSSRIPEDILAWSGRLPDTDTAVALCAPKKNAPSHPSLTADSIRFTMQ